MTSINKLFVYGSLGPGRPNEHILGNIEGSWEEASVHGIWHNEGWGATLGYPGITLDDQGDKIEGFVFCSEHLAEHWAKLDAFEGKEYERMVTTVELSNKTCVKAFIYVLRRTNNN